jgi:hypothetical protein
VCCRTRSHAAFVATGEPAFTQALGERRGEDHLASLTVGVDLAAGEGVIVLDADHQDPPEVILELAMRWREGYDVVYAQRGVREGETTLKPAR